MFKCFYRRPAEVAIPYKSGKYSNVSLDIQKLWVKKEVAIPYKSGKYSNFCKENDMLEFAIVSQSLINQGNILTSFDGIPVVRTVFGGSQSLINQGNILTDPTRG